LLPLRHMDKHRVFLSLNLPGKIKKNFSHYREKWDILPVKWVKEENLHITLIFLGYVSGTEMGNVCKAVKEECSKHPPFNVVFRKVSYFPGNKIPPRMICVLGEGDKELLDLKKGLEKALLEKGVHFSIDMKKFKPHVTLGRVKSWEWRKIEPDERPEVDENINIKVEFNSVEVMESKLKRGGPEYILLESAKLR